MSRLDRVWNALGVVLSPVAQDDSACFAASATALGADTSIMRHESSASSKTMR